MDSEIKLDDQYKILFESIEWESPLPGVRFKKKTFESFLIRIVEYSKTFVEPDWCEKGHIGYVLQGNLEIDFNGKIVSYRAGNAITIPYGNDHKHKAKIISESARVFLIEQIQYADRTAPGETVEEPGLR